MQKYMEELLELERISLIKKYGHYIPPAKPNSFDSKIKSKKTSTNKK